jgi:cellulose biosynthesis protein BcsQ
MDLVIGGAKGGVGKTTTAAFLTSAIAARWPGEAVVGIDADPQSQSWFDWYSLATDIHKEQMPYQVMPWATHDLPRHARTLRDSGQAAHLVIDTGGGNEAMLSAALHNGGVLVIPTRPNLIEMRRIPATLAIAATTEQATGLPVYPHILLVSVDRRTNDEAAARSFLAEWDLPVLVGAVGQSTLYQRAFGHPIPEPGDYGPVFEELHALMTAREVVRA